MLVVYSNTVWEHCVSICVCRQLMNELRDCTCIFVCMCVFKYCHGNRSWLHSNGMRIHSSKEMVPECGSRICTEPFPLALCSLEIKLPPRETVAL